LVRIQERASFGWASLCCSRRKRRHVAGNYWRWCVVESVRCHSTIRQYGFFWQVR
jgi:hypothetical protein